MLEIMISFISDLLSKQVDALSEDKKALREEKNVLIKVRDNKKLEGIRL
jgi:small nuclear ribonucleoprotein (snRNP)-like protein